MNKKYQYCLFAVIAISAVLGLFFLSLPEYPVKWEHGYKTSNVIATRYSPTLIGYNIGFEFFNFSEDDKRIVSILESHNGHLYRAGGYSGSPMMVIFEDVRTADQANKKIKLILSEFDKMFALAATGGTDTGTAPTPSQDPL